MLPLNIDQLGLECDTFVLITREVCMNGRQDYKAYRKVLKLLYINSWNSCLFH